MSRIFKVGDTVTFGGLLHKEMRGVVVAVFADENMIHVRWADGSEQSIGIWHPNLVPNP